MATDFGIGGRFLAALAETGMVSDRDITQIVNAPGGIEEAAMALRLQADTIRHVKASQTRHHGILIVSLRLSKDIKSILADRKLTRVHHLVGAWPTGLRQAGLTPGQVGEVGEELRRLGAIADTPEVDSQNEDVLKNLDD